MQPSRLALGNLCALLLALPLLSSCGGGAAASPIESTAFAPALGVDLAGSTKQSNGVYYRDLTVGSGPAVSSGWHLYLHYSGWLPDGTLFDQNKDTDVAFDFVYGFGSVIVAWNHAFGGMKPGGVRQLIIPPSAGYGANAQGPIPANSILVFNVSLVTAQPPQP